jgi:hypothetical protein
MSGEEHDVRLPQRWAHKITILVESGGGATLKSSMGRWLAEHLNPVTRVRHSAALLADGRFAAISKSEGCEAVGLRVFADIGGFEKSDLPTELIEAARRAL